MDNGFAAADDPAGLRYSRSATAWARPRSTRCCASGCGCPTRSRPRTESAGYRYEMSIRQAEFSLTQMLDRPVSGRMFFEHVMRDNLDIGRPDQVCLIFDRRGAGGPRSDPGTFRTRVITDGVVPCLHIDYKHTKIKQYHKEEGATDRDHDQRHPRLRVETADRTCPRCGRSASPPTGACWASNDSATTRSAPRRPSRRAPRRSSPTPAPHRRAAPGRPPRARPAAGLLVFRLLPRGFANRDLRGLLADLLGRDAISAGQMSYDLRRLRAHGLIAASRAATATGSPRPGCTQPCCSTTPTRLLMPGLAQLTDPTRPHPACAPPPATTAGPRSTQPEAGPRRMNSRG